MEVAAPPVFGGRSSIIFMCPDQDAKVGLVRSPLTDRSDRANPKSNVCTSRGKVPAAHLGMSLSVLRYRHQLISIVLPLQTGGLTNADSGPCCSVLSSCVNPAYRSKTITIDVFTGVSDCPRRISGRAFTELISLAGSKYVRNRNPRHRLWSDINIPERGGARATAGMRRLGFATRMI